MSSESNFKWRDPKKELPKPNKNYLVTYKTPKGLIRVKEAFCECVALYPTDWWEKPGFAWWTKKLNGEVIAWMPLPEPWKGDNE